MDTSLLASDLKQMFAEAATEAAKKRAKLEQETLSDEKIRAYFKKTVEYVADKLHDGGTGKILIGADNCGVARIVWPTFTKILVAALSELGMPAPTTTTDYVHFDRKDVQKLLSSLEAPVEEIDVETKVQTMLHSGVYR